MLNPKSETRNSKQYRNSNVQNSKHAKYNLPWGKVFVFRALEFVSKLGTRPKGGESKRSADNFDLPAKAHRCRRAQAVCTGESGYFQIGTLFQAWQAGIRASNFLADLYPCRFEVEFR